VLCKWLATVTVEAFAIGECPVWSWEAIRGGGLCRLKVGCASKLAEKASLTPALARTWEQTVRRASQAG